ncbi:MAG: putative DNA binding domain-containing protein [Oscillospiraceae bacterium]|nr:putative DNA binding domain-containing protein [Oscillospiraceae bacterium]
MIDFNKLEQYRENNRIEAKKALSGLPRSIWETYSAFANTLGGIILLGVEEYKDKSLHTVDLPDPEKLVKEFWDLVNNPKKTSVNVLTNKHVHIEEVNGDHIIVIEVPRAQRYYKPVYVDGNPVSGTYRRNGEGDYHCTDEELRAMYRDADMKTQDMLVLENMDSSAFCAESIRAYRQRMKLSRPNHVWENLDNDEFLMKLGATGIGEDGRVHPTSAGLLMFGYEYEIVREYPQYFLDYREEYDDIHRWTDRFISSSGDWSGNIFDFYFHVYNKIQLDLKVPFEMKGGFRVDDTPVHKAIREALANCLINADYYGRRGLVIVKKRNLITMSNPGDFRVELDEAKSGGLSDPRNGVMMKMFNLIDIRERAGSGIPSILYVWKQQGWTEPTITQSFDPNRTVLSLPLSPVGDKKPAIKTGDKKPAIKKTLQKNMIIQYLTDNASAKSSDIAVLLGLKVSRVKELLTELIAENIVVAEGNNRNRVYKLKS